MKKLMKSSFSKKFAFIQNIVWGIVSEREPYTEEAAIEKFLLEQLGTTRKTIKTIKKQRRQ
jgi:hypothetical protein